LIDCLLYLYENNNSRNGSSATVGSALKSCSLKNIIGSNYSVIIAIIIGGIIYLSAMMISGGIEKGEVKSLIKRKRS